MPNETGFGASDPGHGNRIVVAERLVEELVKRGHRRPAAAWGIHELVQRGFLLAEMGMEIERPIVGQRLDEQRSVVKARRFFASHADQPRYQIPVYGELTRKPLAPADRPVPYSCLLIRSTPDLWEWVRAERRVTGDCAAFDALIAALDRLTGFVIESQDIRPNADFPTLIRLDKEVEIHCLETGLTLPVITYDGFGGDEKVGFCRIPVTHYSEGVRIWVDEGWLITMRGLRAMIDRRQKQSVAGTGTHAGAPLGSPAIGNPARVPSKFRQPKVDPKVANQKVDEYLRRNPIARIEHVVQNTGLKRRKVEQTDAWKQHVEKRIGDTLKKNPKATTAMIVKGTGFSAGIVNGSNAWKQNRAQLSDAEAKRGVKEVPLTPGILAAAPAPSGEDLEEIDKRVSISEISNAFPPGERRTLQALNEDNREALLTYVQEQLTLEQLEQMSPLDRQALIKETAEGRLEELWEHQRSLQGKGLRHERS
jgi:hypothetical protein